MEKQEFQIGDIAYCIDEDYKEFEDRIVNIHLKADNTISYSGDCDFFKDDIGKWVFKTKEERSDFLSM